MAVQQTKTSINLGLGAQPDIQDARLFNELYRVYNAIKNLAYGLDAYCGTIAQDTGKYQYIDFLDSYRGQYTNILYVKAGEDIVAGALCHFIDDGTGKLQAVNSNAATGKPVRAYAAGAVTSGSFGKFVLPNAINPYYSGLTVGALYYLSTTNGLITATAPSASGQIVQRVGYAISPTELMLATSLEYSVVP